jgi:glucose/mannose-6-phosphate isomerase
MKDYLLQLDSQIEEAFSIGRQFSPAFHFPNVRKVLFCGMGGSAISGDVLRVITEYYSPVLFEVHRGDLWPRWADRETLVLFSSYSGNTQEVLEWVPNAIKTKCQILILTSGGRLGEIAAKKRIPCLKIPQGLPPRCAIGYLSFSLLPVLEQLGRFTISKNEFQETLSVIRNVPKHKAKLIAHQMQGRSVHLYSVAGLMEPAAVRWRAQLAENAKMLVSHHFLPETFHNEIEGWKFPPAVVENGLAVFLTDRADTPFLNRKRKFFQKIIRARGGRVVEIPTSGKMPLARLFSLIALGDWVSYELALFNRIDPMQIEVIEALKKIK